MSITQSLGEKAFFQGTLDIVGVVCALPAEGKALVKSLKTGQKSKVFSDTTFSTLPGGKTMALVISGMGKVKAAASTQWLIDRFSPRWVFNFGCAGGVRTGLEAGDMFLSELAVEYDYLNSEGTVPAVKGDPRILKTAVDFFPDIRLGIMATGDQNGITFKHKKELRDKYRADCCDWESAAVMRVAADAEIPAAAFRVISDVSGQGQQAVLREFKLNIDQVLPPAASTFLNLLSRLPCL
ncbi:MAG: hypothetical protein ACE5GM_08815 [bacterium]